MARLPGVSTQPGASALTRTRGASSSASERVSATTAAFDAQYRSWPGDGTKASIEAKLTIARAVDEVRRGGLGDEQRAEHVDVERAAVELGGGGLERGRRVDAGGVDDGVERAELGDRPLDRRAAAGR